MDGEFTKLLPRCGVDESSCLTKWWRCALFFYHWRTWVVVVLLLTVEAFRREPELPTPDYSEGLPRLLIQPEEGSRPEGSLFPFQRCCLIRWVHMALCVLLGLLSWSIGAKTECCKCFRSFMRCFENLGYIVLCKIWPGVYSILCFHSHPNICNYLLFR